MKLSTLHLLQRAATPVLILLIGLSMVLYGFISGVTQVAWLGLLFLVFVPYVIFMVKFDLRTEQEINDILYSSKGNPDQ